MVSPARLRRHEPSFLSYWRFARYRSILAGTVLSKLKAVANVASFAVGAMAVLSLLALTLLPNVLGYKTYVVLSGSMEPAIHTGSVLMALPVPPESLKVGDVIVYNRSDVNESVTHRIISVDQT